jgi:hypothetical protein
MSPEQIRIEALRLAMGPRDIPANYDPAFYLDRAREFEAYIMGPLADQSQGVVKTDLRTRSKGPAKPEG